MIVRPHGRLSSPQRRCNSVKENVANKEPGKRGRGEEGRAASWFIRPGQRCGNALGTSAPAQSVAANGQSRQASLRGRAPHPVSSRCKRLTQPGSKGSGGSRATQPAPPHLTHPPPPQPVEQTCSNTPRWTNAKHAVAFCRTDGTFARILFSFLRLFFGMNARGDEIREDAPLML